MTTGEIISVGLLALLIAKELADASSSEFGRRLNQSTGVWLVPLLLILAYMVGERVNELV